MAPKCNSKAVFSGLSQVLIPRQEKSEAGIKEALSAILRILIYDRGRFDTIKTDKIRRKNHE
jgi:hypothetical protein